MTTGNEPAQLPAVEQFQQANPVETPQAPIAEVVTEVVDVDDADLNAAVAEAQAEETGATQQTEGTASQPAPAPAPQPAPQKEAPPVAMIPKPRLDQALSEAERLRQENAYLKGRVDAQAAAAPAAPAAPAQPQQTPEQALAAIDAATDDLAKRFDDGEITMAEFKREERKLTSQAIAIREQSRPPAPAPVQQVADDDLYLEAETAKMEKAHPWTFTIDQLGEAEAKPIWRFIEERAVQNLVEKGINPRAGKIGAWHLRNEMAELTDELGPVLAGPRAQAKGIQLPTVGAPPATQQPAQQQRPGLSPQAQARAAGLAKLASAPPDISTLHGHGGNVGGLPTDGALEAMSEADYDALPKATRDRIRLGNAG